jgi:hypothetical protein
MRHFRVGWPLLVLVVSLLGCGGPMRPEELGRSVEAIESAAAEGELLADHVARDRTKATFVRVQARELGDTVVHEAEKLHDADASGSVAAKKARAVELAGQVSQALGDLQVAPDTEAVARASQGRLAKLADRAGRLADAL